MHKNNLQRTVQFCDDPQNILKIFIPPKIFIFLKTPNNIEIQNFVPPKMGQAYVWPNTECCLGSFVIYQGIQNSIAKKPLYFGDFSRGGGVQTLCPPLCMFTI